MIYITFTLRLRYIYFTFTLHLRYIYVTFTLHLRCIYKLTERPVVLLNATFYFVMNLAFPYWWVEQDCVHIFCSISSSISEHQLVQCTAADLFSLLLPIQICNLLYIEKGANQNEKYHQTIIKKEIIHLRQMCFYDLLGLAPDLLPKSLDQTFLPNWF